MGRLTQHRAFVKALLRSKDNSKLTSKHIKKATSAEICTVCEIIKNFLQNPNLQINLTQKQKNLLKKHRRQLNRLLDRQIPVGKKRRILQTGKGVVLPLILGLVAPILNKILSG